VAAENLPLSGNNTAWARLWRRHEIGLLGLWRSDCRIEPISLNSDIDSGNVSTNDCKGIVRGNPQIALFP